MINIDMDRLLKEIEKNVILSNNDQWYEWEINRWTKNSIDRLYINLSYGRSGKWSRKSSVYIDLNAKNLNIIGSLSANKQENTLCWEGAQIVKDILLENN